jgi:hypothetical protein
MIHLENKGRRPNSEELAEVLHELNIGETAKFYGNADEVLRTANSLSRSHKTHKKTRFMCRKLKNGWVNITCIANKKPTTYIVV